MQFLQLILFPFLVILVLFFFSFLFVSVLTRKAKSDVLLISTDFLSIFQCYVEVELMKERFAKLLLGEDMSGGGKGVCTALAISNAITNLSG